MTTPQSVMAGEQSSDNKVKREESKIIYSFTFMKSGPQPQEFCASLTKKMESFIIIIKDLDTKEARSVNRKIKGAISKVVKEVVIRETTTNPARTDQRRSTANLSFAQKKILPTVHTSPSQAERDSDTKPLKRGQTQYSKKLHKEYKKEQQVTLEELLKTKFGNAKDKSSDSCSKTERFCNELDYYTLCILRLKKDEIQQLDRSIYIHCKSLVMGRIAMECVKENDLITHEGWKCWMTHMCVLISFAAMLTALEIGYRRVSDIMGPIYIYIII